MTVRRALAAIWLLCALPVAGCGNGGDGDDNDDPTGDPQVLVEGLAAAQCAKIFECCSSEQRTDVFGSQEIADETSCRDALRTQAEAFFRPTLQKSLDDERATLDDARVADCAATIEARTCADFEPTPSIDALVNDGCTEVLGAELALSAFCTEDYECRTGFCSRAAAQTEGACKNPPQVGEPCLNDRCGEGLYCTGDDICAEKLGAGDVCTRNADCDSDSCAPGEDGEFVCAELPDICGG